jgi:hemolysin activation/secretion protein
LPTQDIVNGVVTIEINEAIFGRVVMDGPSSKRVHAQRIEDTILAFQPPGAKLNAHNIDRALAVLSDLAGIHVQGQLVAGAQTGRTDFVVTTQDGPAASVDTSADNAGARSTGTARVTLGMTLNSPLNRGDLLSANAMASEGSDYLRTAYRWPVGPTGWTMGLHASRLNYNARLTTASGGVNSSLQLTGRADSVGLETIYPLAKRNRYKLDASLAWDQKNYLNKRDEVVDSRYDTRALSAGLQGQFADADAGGGFSTWQLMGTVADLQAKEGSVTAGRYNKLKYAFNRTQVLTPRWSLVAALNGQASQTNVDASEKFYLGGMTGVRAYPRSEGGGSSGQLLNLEVRHRFSNHRSWFAFYDHGQVEVNPNSSDALNNYALKGYGLGYGFVSPQGLNLKAMVARRLGSNPNPTATGQDQDGSLVVNRFWLSASLKF